ncbi:MAG: hypothetical protein FJW22_05745 [Acidimicrobiia bacterium]|nr:hypothetical protein [Acidimicrobiia bacterium]
MRRGPGFPAGAILSLGLGAGVNTAMLPLVDSLLFRPLPVTSPDTLVDVFTTGGDAAIAGQLLTLGGLQYSIVGVAPPSFTGVVPLLTPEWFLPITDVEEVEPVGITDQVASPTGSAQLERRGWRWMSIKGPSSPV